MGLFSTEPKPEFVVRLWDGERWLRHEVYDDTPMDVFIERLQEQNPGCPIEVVQG